MPGEPDNETYEMPSEVKVCIHKAPKVSFRSFSQVFITSTTKTCPSQISLTFLLDENNSLSSLDEQVGQIQDMFYEDNSQAKNGFHICEGWLRIKSSSRSSSNRNHMWPTSQNIYQLALYRKVCQLALENYFIRNLSILK